VEVVGVAALGVQRVRSQEHPGQVDPVQQRGERGDLAGLAALPADLGLPEDHPAGGVERGQQMNLGPVLGAGAASGLAVDGDHLHRAGWRRGSAGGQPGRQHRVQRVEVDQLQDPADRGLARRGAADAQS
jgi:hypothetical protein